MYLEAIFGSPDIVRQLPVAAKMFKTVDVSWKATMKVRIKMNTIQGDFYSS